MTCTVSLETTLANRIGDRCRGPITRYDSNPRVLINEWGLQNRAKQFICVDRVGEVTDRGKQAGAGHVRGGGCGNE